MKYKKISFFYALLLGSLCLIIAPILTFSAENTMAVQVFVHQYIPERHPSQIKEYQGSTYAVYEVTDYVRTQKALGKKVNQLQEELMNASKEEQQAILKQSRFLTTVQAQKETPTQALANFTVTVSSTELESTAVMIVETKNGTPPYAIAPILVLLPAENSIVPGEFLEEVHLYPKSYFDESQLPQPEVPKPEVPKQPQPETKPTTPTKPTKPFGRLPQTGELTSLGLVLLGLGLIALPVKYWHKKSKNA